MTNSVMQNFELILLIVTISSLLIGALDKWYFQKLRQAKVAQSTERLDEKTKAKLLKPPFLAEQARSLCGVFVLVLLIRSFGVEAYRVPSGSMLPTIQLNDFVLVNKFTYGLRWPLSHHLFLKFSQPKRGDILVFEHPVDPDVDLVKTVVGLPGDRVSYLHKQLYINDQLLPQSYLGTQAVHLTTSQPMAVELRQSSQDFGASQHHIYDNPKVPALDFKDVTVPPHHYFVMGDNRDDSEDSRYWGFVPEQNIVGQAVVVLFSVDTQAFRLRFDRFFHRLPGLGA